MSKIPAGTKSKQLLASVTLAVKQGLHVLCLTLSLLHTNVLEACGAKKLGELALYPYILQDRQVEPLPHPVSRIRVTLLLYICLVYVTICISWNQAYRTYKDPGSTRRWDQVWLSELRDMRGRDLWGFAIKSPCLARQWYLTQISWRKCQDQFCL